MSPWIALGTTFTASALECVEAATIVMAVGYTAGWRVALSATAWALAALVAICALLGPVLLLYVPIAGLKIVIGVFLLLFGYTWLRKAIWRFAGLKSLRDENAAFEKEVRDLRAHHERRYAFATAFNGVLVEGLEVAVIVVTFAAERAGTFLWAAAGALSAAATVAAAAFVLRHPFSRIPENAMGFIVGVMLLSFGTFWSAEGLGLQWWSGDGALPTLVAAYALSGLVLSAVLRKPVRA